MSQKNPRECYTAVEENDEVRLAELIKTGVNLNAMDVNGFTVATYAVIYGHEGCLARLIAAGCDIDAKDAYGKTAAMWAAAQGHVGCLAKLIEAGCDIDAKDLARMTATVKAIGLMQAKCLEMLRFEFELRSLMASTSSASSSRPAIRI